MTVTVAQSRLILNTFMATLRDNLAYSDLIEWETHSDEMNDRNGMVVTEQVDPQFNITETTGAVADLSSGTQNVVFGAQTFTLNKVFGLSMGAGDLEMVTDMREARRNRALRSGTERLASRIDMHIAKTAFEAFPWSTGTWGTALDTPEEVATARTRLAVGASIEKDRGLNGLITHDDRALLAKYLYNDNASLASEGSKAMRQGFAGMISNVPLKATNVLYQITTGTRDGAGAILGASQDVDYTEASDSGSNAGRYLTQTLLVDGMGAGATVKAGEVFTIANVNAWNAELNQSRGIPQQFVVLADATADSAGSFSLTIFPAIIVKTGTNVVNNAHATVDAAPANDAVVTFLGAASTTYQPRMIFRNDAIVAHSAQLVMPYTGTAFRRSLQTAERDGVAPLMPRLWFYSDPATGAHNARIDVFMQAQPRDRWAGVKFFGS
jgi:hypothetical protein